MGRQEAAEGHQEDSHLYLPHRLRCLYMGKNRHVRHGDTGVLKIDTCDTGVLKIDGHRKLGNKNRQTHKPFA